jgi:hypothetical protein
MIAYEGNSLLNGDPIALILTDSSTNRKTGTMIQSWIIPAKDSVMVNDVAVCGDCPLREGACYVTKFFAPNNIQKTYWRGGYEKLDTRWLRNEVLRIGSWGDPAAIPYDVWADLLRRTHLPERFTGYTHQWRTCDTRFATICMASVETLEDAELAHSMGYKTFRVKSKEEAKQPNETECLNRTVGLSCKNCLLCNTTSGDIVIDVHGSINAVYKYRDYRNADSTTGAQPNGDVLADGGDTDDI